MAQWVREGMADAMLRAESDSAWIPISKSPFATLLPKQKAPMWMVAGIAFVVLGGGFLMLVDPPFSHSEQHTETTTSQIAKAPQATAPSSEAEAVDVVHVLDAYYPLGQEVAKASWDWATCHDETKGYGKALKCAREALGSVQRVVPRMPKHAIAHSACGAAIENAHLRYVIAERAYLSDTVDFLTRSDSSLRRLLVNKSLSDASDDKALAGLPLEGTGKYKDANYGQVTQIDCTKRLFICGEPDNVCWINKVAARVGLAGKESCLDGSRHCELRVRDTGALIKPTSGPGL